MRHDYHCPDQRAYEQQRVELQLQVAVEEQDAKAKALLAYQNAMFAAAYCRKDNGRCEGCGQ